MCPDVLQGISTGLVCKWQIVLLMVLQDNSEPRPANVCATYELVCQSMFHTLPDPDPDRAYFAM